MILDIIPYTTKIIVTKNYTNFYFYLIMKLNFVRHDFVIYGNLVGKSRDLFVRLEERLYDDFPQFKNYETYFEVNGKRIKRFQTLEQNKIKNNDIINIFIIEE